MSDLEVLPQKLDRRIHFYCVGANAGVIRLHFPFKIPKSLNLNAISSTRHLDTRSDVYPSPRFPEAFLSLLRDLGIVTRALLLTMAQHRYIGGAFVQIEQL
ncbi:hypothetical protein DFP72DRAFT_1077613 [Ephemerocybe angulata]|uniref:Uncharacterized protein n=1 Tax=Ephemerocybe angulata TaxID=980116 RepID=A0A8H6LYJ7_9AGAR|nr:hypothetical protein DFP72DRAFT_1077613 [Tulosesus angulatus]